MRTRAEAYHSDALGKAGTEKTGRSPRRSKSSLSHCMDGVPTIVRPVFPLLGHGPGQSYTGWFKT